MNRISMAIAESLLAEFETQAPITRRFLERLPEDKLGPVPVQPLSAEEHAKNNLPDVLARWQLQPRSSFPWQDRPRPQRSPRRLRPRRRLRKQ